MQKKRTGKGYKRKRGMHLNQTALIFFQHNIGNGRTINVIGVEISLFERSNKIILFKKHKRGKRKKNEIGKRSTLIFLSIRIRCMFQVLCAK